MQGVLHRQGQTAAGTGIKGGILFHQVNSFLDNPGFAIGDKGQPLGKQLSGCRDHRERNSFEFLESIKELKQKDPYIDHLSKPLRSVDYLMSINKLLLKRPML